jgi:predicted acetyltransferase
MRSEAPNLAGQEMSLGLEVIPATREQEPILANLLELYSHDFSELIDLELGPDGRFGYPQLPVYWQEPNRHPFLIRLDGRIAGFALVTRGSRLNRDPDVWDMTEFFVARPYRKRGVGTAAAQRVWAGFPGAWEVRVIARNEPARAFWRAALRSFTGSTFREAAVPIDGKPWSVFTFVSPAAVPAA